MTGALSPAFEQALRTWRQGDEAGAIRQLEHVRTHRPGDARVRSLLGTMLCRAGRAADGVVELQAGLRLQPDDDTIRANLAKALLSLRRTDEVGALLAETTSTDVRLLRLRGFLAEERGAFAEAADAYAAVIASCPSDFEALNNLGNALQALGDWDGAIDALRRSISIRPDVPPVFLNLSRALGSAKRHDERLATIRDAVQRFPPAADLYLELGLAAAAADRIEDAEAALRQAMTLDPRGPAAYVELALLLEKMNRLPELDALAAEADANGVAPGECAFILGWSLRRRGDFQAALQVAETIPETIAAMRRHQLIAELADRLGQTERAFAEFSAMNREEALLHPEPPGQPSFIGDIRATTRRLARIAAPSGPDAATSDEVPIFIAGFPRSGTTLLDTLLMNAPHVHVLEERPTMERVRAQMGDDERLVDWDEAGAGWWRRAYFDAVRAIDPPRRAGLRIIDKHPFHMTRMDLVHRIFPTAKIVFVERHPCDAVLSCFMQMFELNRATRSFLTLKGSATLYDAALECWSRACERLPIAVHRVRYERMVADLEGEMRALFAFLGFEWHRDVLDNEAAAARRGHIKTASYAQVGQPIYRRAAGRWQRYRAQLEPVLPLLRPWAEAMDYGI